MTDHFTGIGLSAFLIVLVTMAGCAGDAGVADNPLPASDVETVSLGVEGAWSVNLDTADDLVTDETGAYFCLLRRADDLASLRSQFFDHELGK